MVQFLNCTHSNEPRRQKALMLKREKEAQKRRAELEAARTAKQAKKAEDEKKKNELLSQADRIVQYHNTKLVDSGAGFFVAENDLIAQEEAKKNVSSGMEPDGPRRTWAVEWNQMSLFETSFFFFLVKDKNISCSW